MAAETRKTPDLSGTALSCKNYVPTSPGIFLLAPLGSTIVREITLSKTVGEDDGDSEAADADGYALVKVRATAAGICLDSNRFEAS